MIRDTRPRLRAVLLAAVLVVALLASAGAGVAAANHEDDSDDSDWFGDGVDDEDAGAFERVVEIVAKSLSQASRGAAKALSSTPFSDDPPTADESAQDGLEAFNENNETIRTWANSHLSGDADHEVFRITFTDRDDGTAPVYVVADYNTSSGEYTSATAYDQSGFDVLDRQVDANVEWGWYASENADEELETWVDKFGEDNESMTSRYRANMLRKYADDVEHDLS